MIHKSGLGVLLGLVLLVALIDHESCFVDSAEVEDVKQENSHEKNDSLDDSLDSSKEKKSQEDIMFGNQQNSKHSVLESMLGISLSPEIVKTLQESHDDNETVETEPDGSVTLKKLLKDGGKELHDFLKNVPEVNENEREDIPLPSERANNDGPWYKEPMSSDALNYVLNTPPMQALPSDENVNLYDQDEVYRRKRQLPISLRKRSLRSPIGQMIQSRGRRLPRRSMRYKRQVDLEELLSMLENNEANDGERFYDEEQSSNIQNPLNKRESSFRYHYNFGRNGEMMPEDDDDNDAKETLASLDDSLIFPPSPRFPDPSDYSELYSTKPDETEAPSARYPDWMERSVPHPSIFTVSRRSAPLFYPIDYRYMPGYKKRSKKDEANYGKWGRVVQAPSAYATAEDVAKLYALAHLLAEGEMPEDDRIRRTA